MQNKQNTQAPVRSPLLQFLSKVNWQEGQDLVSWSENLLFHLAQRMEALQAALYGVNDDETLLYFIAGYSISEKAELPKRILFGDGLLGHVAKSQQIKRIKGQRGINIFNYSSEQEIVPEEIYVVPLVFNNKTCGVIEISHISGFSAENIELFEKSFDPLSAQLSLLIKDKQLQNTLRRVRENEERYRMLAEVTGEGIVFLDDRNRILEFNPPFARLFAYEPSEIKGKQVTDFLCSVGNEDIMHIRSTNEVMELIGMRKDRSCFYAEVAARQVEYHGLSLCVITFRDISDRKKDKEELKQKDEQLQQAQKIVQLKDALEEQNTKILASINYARRIQKAFLQDKDKIISEFSECFIFLRPRDVVSGDFYWYSIIEQENNRLIMLAAVDCTGHGVPGAFMCLIGIEMLSRIVNEQKFITPDIVLFELNKAVRSSLRQDESDNRDGMDAAICLIDKKNDTLYFSGAKNPLLYVPFKLDGQTELTDEDICEIKGDKYPIGGSYVDKDHHYTLHKVPISAANGFYIYSDGYEDQFGGPLEKKFSKKRLKKLIAGHHYLTMGDQKEVLISNLESWQGSNAQVDDILLIGFRP